MGAGPAAGTSATTCTPGPWYIGRMYQALEDLPINFGLLGKGNASLPLPLNEQVEAGVMGQLVDDRPADFLRQILGVGEVLLERQPEQDDPGRDRDEVAAPLVERDALVQPVQRLVRGEAVLAPLVRRGFVGDH